MWLNWVVRRLDDGRAVGTVQATVAKEGIDLVAEVAWVTDYQGRGYARKAAQLMVTGCDGRECALSSRTYTRSTGRRPRAAAAVLPAAGRGGAPGRGRVSRPGDGRDGRLGRGAGAGRLAAALTDPFLVGRSEFGMGVSVGVAV